VGPCSGASTHDVERYERGDEEGSSADKETGCVADAAHGAVSAVEYAPAEGAQLVGCLLLTPGSGGGLGPGVAVHPQPFDDIRKPAHLELGSHATFVCARKLTSSPQKPGAAVSPCTEQGFDSQRRGSLSPLLRADSP
jgi:hypothetical protein